MGLPLTLGNWILALIPLLLLLVGLLKTNWGAPKVGLISWLASLVLGWLIFGGHVELLFHANLKGLSLTAFVVLIIWSSVLLYNIVDRSGGISIFKERISSLVQDDLLRFLLMAWCLSGAVQGVAGFGVPVAIVAPLMKAMGFNALQAAAATLVGHAWSISFGSMAASFYTIQLVTQLEPSRLASWMGIQFAIPTLLSGFAVAHIYGGMAAMRRSAAPILIAGFLMAFVMWFSASSGLPQMATLLAGLAGTFALGFLSRRSRKASSEASNSPGFLVAVFPYLFLMGLIILSQVPAIKAAVAPFRFAPNFPEMATRYGYTVAAERGYAAIGLFSHPAPLIVMTIIVTALLLKRYGLWAGDILGASLKVTRKQCTAATVSIATMVMMALVMNDTGMTTMLAHGLARAGQGLFPLMSPYLGVLGCFMTGSNTNSNVLFGKLQMETALALGMNVYIIAALQSVGGSLGSSIAPAKVLVASATTGLAGQERELLRKTIPYCLVIVFVAGMVAWILISQFPMM